MLFRKCQPLRKDYLLKIKKDDKIVEISPRDGDREKLTAFYDNFKRESDTEIERKREVFRERNKLDFLQKFRKYGLSQYLEQHPSGEPNWAGFSGEPKWEDPHLDIPKSEILTFIVHKRNFWRSWKPYLIWATTGAIAFAVGELRAPIFNWLGW